MFNRSIYDEFIQMMKGSKVQTITEHLKFSRSPALESKWMFLYGQNQKKKNIFKYQKKSFLKLVQFYHICTPQYQSNFPSAPLF